MKLDKAKEDYELLKSAITQSESNDTQDIPTFKVLEEGAPPIKKKPVALHRGNFEIHSTPAGCSGPDRKQNLWNLQGNRQTDLQGKAAGRAPCHPVHRSKKTKM
ncbi:MAG: hypothetical protein R2751_03680 [Bacteroidales bacterium]